MPHEAAISQIFLFIQCAKIHAIRPSTWLFGSWVLKKKTAENTLPRHLCVCYASFMFPAIRFWLKSGSIVYCKIVNRMIFYFMLSSKHMTCLYRLTIERMNKSEQYQVIGESPVQFIWEVHYFTINVFSYYIILSSWSGWLWISGIAEFVHNCLLHYCRTKVKNRGFHACYCLSFPFFF